METVFIDLNWVGSSTPVIIASCKIAGVSATLKGRTKTFATEKELVDSLARAGVPEREYLGTINTLKSGYKTFLWLTLEQAQRLEMIERVDR
jgi:hypothetical protein